MEMLDVVNEDGTLIGETVERETAHLSGIRHCIFHVWLLQKRNDKTQVLLQKRSLNKGSHPGCYNASGAGHIPSGENFLESSLRELKGEFGITAVVEELVCCGCCCSEYRGVFHGQSFWDNQVSNVYILWRDVEESEFILQEFEVDFVLWVDWDKCLDMVRHKKASHRIWIDELELVSSFVPLLDESGQPSVTPPREY